MPPCCCAPTGKWHTVSAKVIAGMVDSGILDDDDQDQLADTLLWNEQVHDAPHLVDRHHLCRIFSRFSSTGPDDPPSIPTHPRPRTVRYGRRCGPGLLAVSSLDAEQHRCATSSNTHGRCQRAMRPPS